VHAFIKHAVVGDDVGGVAVHEQLFEIRVVGEQLSG
jgi:hypothetical protein